MEIDIADRQSDVEIDHERLRKVLERTLNDAGCANSLSVALVTAEEMTDLNDRYAGRGELTDVLSFPLDEEDLLGDVVVCPAKAKEEASARSRGAEDEVMLYAVHGTLHLLGYDDHGPNAERMYAREDEILRSYGVEVD